MIQSQVIGHALSRSIARVIYGRSEGAPNSPFADTAIASLFAASEQGAWYDPSDISRYMMLAATELVSNGTFATDTTSWVASGTTLSVLSGRMKVEATAAGGHKAADQTFTTVSGKWYEIAAEVEPGVGGKALVHIASGASDAVLEDVSGAGSITYVRKAFLAISNSYSVTLRPGDSGAYGAIGDTAFFDNVSVREIPNINTATMFQDSGGTTPVTATGQPVGKILDKSGRGNHATQATSAARPVLQQDAGGKYYLAFDGVDDVLGTASFVLSSLGRMTSTFGVKFDVITGFHGYLQLGIAGNTGSAWSYANNTDFELKAAGATAITSAVYNGLISTAAAVQTQKINLAGATSSDCVGIRKNGVDVTASGFTAPGPCGVSAFQNSAMSIGLAAGVFLQGRIYSVIVRGETSTAQEIVDAETYVNSKTGAY